MAQKLEKAYNRYDLRETGKSYTFDSTELRGWKQPFTPYECSEYIMDGAKYVRVVGKAFDKYSVLWGGREVVEGEPYWVEVQPIEWLSRMNGKMNMA